MNKNDINYAIEYSFVGMYKQYDGVVNVYNPEGNYMTQFPGVDFFEFNKAGLTRLQEEQAEKSITEMIKFFQTKGSKSFGWIVGPLTTPTILPNYLKKHNFEIEESAWGMYLPIDSSLEVSELRGLTIREATLEDVENENVQEMMEKAYGLPEGSAKLMVDLFKIYQKETKLATYIAYDGEKPVAFGNLVLIPGTKGGLLAGAATLQEYRGRGIYSNMLKRRKEKAREFGIEYLVIQANAETSAPIAKKHGFEKTCDLDLWVYKG